MKSKDAPLRLFEEIYWLDDIELIFRFPSSESFKILKAFKRDLFDKGESIKEVFLQKRLKSMKRFSRGRKTLNLMLLQSEKRYRSLQFIPDDFASHNSYVKQEQVLSEFLDEYHEAKELSEDVKKIRDSIKYKRKDIKKKLGEISAEKITANQYIKTQFVNNEWKMYQKFFKEHPQIKEILKIHEKEDLIPAINNRKKIQEQLRKKELSHRKKDLIIINEMIESISSYQDFFTLILISSLKNYEISKESISREKGSKKKFYSELRITLNAKEAHDLFFRHVLKEPDLELTTPLKVDKEKYLLQDIEELMNDALLARFGKYNRNVLEFKEMKENLVIKLSFHQIIKDLFNEFYKKYKKEIPIKEERVIKKKIEKKEIVKTKQRRSYHGVIEKYHLKTAIPLLIVIPTIIIGFTLYGNIPIVVEQNDSVKIDYTAWESDEQENYDILNPIIDKVVWVSMIPITENSSTGLILGLYNNLLGKKLLYESDIMWLNKCIDQDRDGIDDVTGRPALTYGNSTDQYFNTCLMIEFKVLDIEKAINPDQFDNAKELIALILFITSVMIISILGITLAISLYKKYKEKKRHEPQLGLKITRTKKSKLLKYGMLILMLCIIPLIILGLVNLNFPLRDIEVLSSKHPLLVPFLVSFIVIACIGSIPVYLILYGIIARKVRTKKEL